MTPPVMLAVLTVSTAVGLGIWLVLGAFAPERRRTVENLHRGRVASPVARSLGTTSAAPPRQAALGRRLTAAPVVGLLERQYVRAGRPPDWPVDRLLAVKLLWAPVGVLLVLWAVAANASPLLTGTVLVVAVVGYFLPELLLLSRAQHREQQIQVELADTLDQLTIVVEAGVGFESALSRVAQNGHGVLAEELTRTLQDMRMGLSRRQALEDLADRTAVVDLRRFVRSLLQADAHGVSIGDVLRTQASEMRVRRRQRAEEKAQRVPVLVLMPLMLCILPVLFIVIMTPVVIDIISAFLQL
ncbi:type II secretion system F family protein [Isoptericola sediminis]|uniref:Type II secretion system F family protein n=1 Tax=Isoptericola sediminis TaxID=2733572 RepID=A0A849K658_9MICO|nr:type II secretion system F family protein [Isoptericola sediminis]NNU27255.1 type II secretion system F family protein [Isoptericola sediminis]